jgi:hypothetical protein
LTEPWTPIPGDVGFGVIAGRVGGWVNLGQAWLGDGCRFTHTYLVVAPDLCIEAMPGGARWGNVHDRLGPGHAYARLPLTDEQRAALLPEAQKLRYARGGRGVGYSFLDYAALGLWHYGIRAPWLRYRIQSSGHMICSQLVDYLLCRVGHHVFTDGRLPQDVTPGALFYATDPRVIKPPPE